MSDPNPIAALISGVDQIIAMNSPELVPKPGADVNEMIGRWKDLDADERSWTVASLACAQVMLQRVQVQMLGELVQAVRAGNGIATAGFGALGDGLVQLAGRAPAAAETESPAVETAPRAPQKPPTPAGQVIPMKPATTAPGGRSRKKDAAQDDAKEDSP